MIQVLKIMKEEKDSKVLFSTSQKFRMAFKQNLELDRDLFKEIWNLIVDWSNWKKKKKKNKTILEHKTIELYEKKNGIDGIGGFKIDQTLY